MSHDRPLAAVLEITLTNDNVRIGSILVAIFEIKFFLLLLLYFDRSILEISKTASQKASAVFMSQFGPKLKLCFELLILVPSSPQIRRFEKEKTTERKNKRLQNTCKNLQIRVIFFCEQRY